MWLDNATIGLFTGIISFMPIAFLYIYLTLFISDILSGFFHSNRNTNTDDFMVSFLCFIPAIILSLIGGIIGGDMGSKKNYRYLGAIIGGLCGPLITILPLALSISLDWAGRRTY